MNKNKICIIGDGNCPCLPVAAGKRPKYCLLANKFKCPYSWGKTMNKKKKTKHEQAKSEFYADWKTHITTYSGLYNSFAWNKFCRKVNKII